MKKIALVAAEKRTNPKKSFYSYLVPESLNDFCRIGSIVQIPFGKDRIRGVVFGFEKESISGIEYKEIISVLEFILPQKYLEIIRWISQYYLCSLGEALSLFLPPAIKKPRKSDIFYEKQIIERNLTKEQEGVVRAICSQMDSKAKKPILLHGVTGSGKTEIYLTICQKIIASGKQVIVLVPEIMLSTQLVERFRDEFGEMVTLLHSELSQSEKFLAYDSFYRQEKKIILGPRSALLVPSNNLGLIILDEEQEDAYKQEKAPRYHAKTLAEKLANETGSVLILGSATPDLESYYRGKMGEMLLCELKSRYQKEDLPEGEIVDLKGEIRGGNYSPISIKLQKEIEKSLTRGEQILLFLNRRGVATFVSCRECGYVVECPNCALPLVFHMDEKAGFLICHHCDHRQKVTYVCPECKGVKIKYFGAGVRKIEQEILALFPKARVAVAESSGAKKGDYQKIFDSLKQQKIDILIGTQIIAKGLDIPTVGLVGVVSADVGLHMPHYRAEEKVFQILTQVSGRSGRREKIGKTIIQSYWPDSKAIRAAADHNYLEFYESEIAEREKFNYPPFCKLVRIISEDVNEARAKKNLAVVEQSLKQANIEYIGPGKCFYSKINRRYRFHILIKQKRQWPNEKIEEIYQNNPYVIWDVEPTDLL